MFEFLEDLDFPYIKFIVLWIGFGILIWFAGTPMNVSFKWRALFVFIATPIGLAVALAGKTLPGLGVSNAINARRNR